MATDAHVIHFSNLDEPVTIVYDDVAKTVTAITELGMGGSVYLGTVEPVPEPEIVETEPINDGAPDPGDE